MKNCDYYEKSFSEYLDETIDEDGRAQLQAHLHDCDTCREKVQSLRTLKTSLASLPRVTTSEYFNIILQSKIRQETRTNHARNWSLPLFELGWKVPAFAVVALFLIFIGAQLQRLSSVQSNQAPTGNMATVQKALQGELNYIDPGYMIVSLDSSRNTLKVMNYQDLDKAKSLDAVRSNFHTEDYLIQNILQDEQLPNLKDAPQNRARVRTTMSQRQAPQVTQVEFVF